jgi:addiction module HigA family antidote
MPMKKPEHPGSLILHECIEPLGLTVATAAEALGVTRQALHNVVSGKSAVSPEMAVRLSKAFGSSPEMWLRAQMNYDLSRVPALAVKRIRFRLRTGTPPGMEGMTNVTAAKSHQKTSGGKRREELTPG